jgi:hypothetical protein
MSILPYNPPPTPSFPLFPLTLYLFTSLSCKKGDRYAHPDYPHRDAAGKAIRQAKVLKQKRQCPALSNAPPPTRELRIKQPTEYNDEKTTSDEVLFYDARESDGPEVLRLQKATEAPATPFSENVRSRQCPFPVGEPYNETFLRTMREYCQATCRSVVSGTTSSTGVFSAVVNQAAPRVVLHCTDKHEEALLHLTRQLG